LSSSGKYFSSDSSVVHSCASIVPVITALSAAGNNVKPICGDMYKKVKTSKIIGLKINIILFFLLTNIFLSRL
jgi:hypothetical protein